MECNYSIFKINIFIYAGQTMYHNDDLSYQRRQCFKDDMRTANDCEKKETNWLVFFCVALYATRRNTRIASSWRQDESISDRSERVTLTADQ